MTEALRRRCGVTLYDVQLQASVTLARGGVAEMQTGEGKTFACAPATYLLGLTGLGVHVVNPNAYLAQRDFTQLAPAYEMLGTSIGLLRDGDTPTAKRTAYLSDVTYGTGYEFGFDYPPRSAGRTLGGRHGSGRIDPESPAGRQFAHSTRRCSAPVTRGHHR